MSAFNLSSLQLAGITITSSLLYLLLQRYLQSRRSDLKKVQGVAGGHWLWGHEYEAFQRPMDQFFTENAKTLGHAYTMKGSFFHPDILVVTDPGALSHIFTKRVYNYTKGDFMRPLIARLVGKGLPWYEGEDHKKQRHMLSSAFTPSMVKGMQEDVRNAADKLAASLHTHIATTGGDKVVRVDMVNWTWRATLDTIGAVCFGHDFQSGQSAEAKQICASWRNMVNMGLGMTGFAGPLITRTFPWITRLPLAVIDEQAGIRRTVVKLAHEIVENRKRGGQESGGRDLLSVLLRANEKGEDLQSVIDHICTFIIAGHETTVTTINLGLWSIAKNKAMQDRLRQELNEFVGSGPGGEPTYDDYQTRLPYLDAVCKESLRLFPSVSHTERVAREDDILPLRYPITSNTGEKIDSIKITKGQFINISPIAINHSETAWGPDAGEFRPERWLDSSKMPVPSSLTQGWSGMFTFIEGPRLCIGYRLAVLEFKIILSTLIQQFEFSDSGADIRPKWTTALQPVVWGQEHQGVQLPINVKLAA